jgi:EDD domain protein, DegV family
MNNYIITTDSNADLPADYIKKHELTIIPQYYAFGDIVYGDELLLTPEEFYKKMSEGELPTSMANNPEVIRDKFKVLLEQGFDILHVAFSSNLSGSYNNVVMIANELLEEYPERNIMVFDSLNVSLGEALFVMGAIDKKEAGESIETVFSWLESIKSKASVQFTVDDLKHLQRGGRISKTTSIVLGIANIKPLLHLVNGELKSLGTVRGRKRSMSTLVTNMFKIIEDTNSTCNRIGIVHANALQDTAYMSSLIKEKYPQMEIIINDISPSIGTHAGPGTLGLCYLCIPK